jgi:3',5'-cyclic AMP phosphodiesterase CpdA
MLIAQLSDLHIRRPGELAYRRVDTATHLKCCVANLLAQRPLPDIVVATGDLADFGRAEEYEHLAELLAPLPMPLYLIPGNHDRRDALRAAFPQHHYLHGGEEFIQYTVPAGPLQIVALDTLLPGEGGGLLCQNRLRWLEEQLVVYRQRPVVILMHHPPFVTGIAFMDRVGLQTAYPLEPIIRRHANIERILCGHLHRTIIARFGGTVAVTCPSPAHQVALDLLPDRLPQFVMEPPGYMLHRWSDERFVTFGVAVGEFDGPYPFYEQGQLIDGATRADPEKS